MPVSALGQDTVIDSLKKAESQYYILKNYTGTPYKLDDSSIKLLEGFQESRPFSFDFFEEAYHIAKHFWGKEQFELSRYFLHLIIENDSLYPIPEKWNRLSSKTYYVLGNIDHLSGQDENAIDNYLKSAKAYEAFYAPGFYMVRSVYGDIAELYRSTYKFEDAITYHKKIVNNISSDNLEIANSYINISHCYKDLKEFDIALEYIDRAMGIHEKLKFKDLREMPIIYNAYGNVYEGLSKLEEALFYYKKARNTQNEIEGIESANVAFYNNNIGNVFLQLTQNDSALVYYKKALVVREQILDYQDKELIHSYYNVGYAYSKLGFLDSALIYCDKSIGSNLGINPGEISLDYMNGDNPVSISDYIISLCDKAEYYYLQYNQNNNEIASLNKAYDSIKKALIYSNKISDDIENYYSDLSWTLFEKRIVDIMVKIFHQYESVIDSKSNMSLIGSIIKKNRIHNKYLYLNNENSSTYNGVNDELLSMNRKHLKQFLSEKGIKTIENHGPGFETSAVQCWKLKTSEFEYEELQKQLQKLIKPKQIILDYLLSDSLLIINLISKNTIEREVVYAPDLKESVYCYLSDLKKLNCIDAPSDILYSYLFKPISKKIEHKDLIIIPDEYLYRLPFEAINLPGSSTHPRFVIQKFNVSYSFSIQNLLKNKVPDWEKYQYSYTGLTPFSDIPTDLYLSNSKDTLLVYKYLPETYNEIKNIDQQYENLGKKSKVYVGREATLENLLENRASSSIIHVASHNIVDLKDSFLSHLLLYFDDKSTVKFDNILYLPLVPFIGLSTNLVILDGCETGNGKLVGSEGVLSMAHAFSTNDISGIVFSIFKISDTIAKDLITNFIGYLNTNNNMDQSLKKVKLDLINSNYSHPYFWSGILAYKNHF